MSSITSYPVHNYNIDANTMSHGSSFFSTFKKIISAICKVVAGILFPPYGIYLLCFANKTMPEVKVLPPPAPPTLLDEMENSIAQAIEEYPGLCVVATCIASVVTVASLSYLLRPSRVPIIQIVAQPEIAKSPPNFFDIASFFNPLIGIISLGIFGLGASVVASHPDIDTRQKLSALFSATILYMSYHYFTSPSLIPSIGQLFNSVQSFSTILIGPLVGCFGLSMVIGYLNAVKNKKETYITITADGHVTVEKPNMPAWADFPPSSPGLIPSPPPLPVKVVDPNDVNNINALEW